MDDLISRQAAIDKADSLYRDTKNDECYMITGYNHAISDIRAILKSLPSAQPEQRYTEEELRVFQHGISLSLLSKRSSQHWQYDEDTATEIKFLERLYEKVGADMKGRQG